MRYTGTYCWYEVSTAQMSVQQSVLLQIWIVIIESLERSYTAAQSAINSVQMWLDNILYRKKYSAEMLFGCLWPTRDVVRYAN